MKNNLKTNNLVDDKQYWRDRHVKQDNLKASGIKSVGVKSNKLIYKMLASQYKKLLDELDISRQKSIIDCGFGDGYFLEFFNQNYPNLRVSGVDISPAAKKKVEFRNKQDLYTADLSKTQLPKKFDIAHSFDVLYHVLEDEDYNSALRNIARMSNRYVILHERFLSRTPIISSKHVRMRRAELTNQVLNSEGFYLSREIPTHFIALRMFTYKLNKIMPGLLYRIDNFIAKSFHPSTQETLASHHIRVYEKRP